MTPPVSAFGAPPQGGRVGQGTVPADCALPTSAGGVLATGAPSGPAEPDPRRLLGAPTPLDARSLSRLKWQCRRGLLENDLFIERFFCRHEETITTRQAAGLQTLMDLADNDLLDLLLARSEPQVGVDAPEVHEVLAMLRSAPLGAGRQSRTSRTVERPPT